MKNTVLLIVVAFIITAQPSPAMADYGRFNNNDLGHPIGWLFGFVMVVLCVREHYQQEMRRQKNSFLNQERGENHDR